MVKSAKSQLDEEDEPEDYDSSSYKGEVVKAESKSSEPKANANRFQALRDLIPQNDQKRDKASFLLEVIEYIQFLQDKLQMYEGSYEGWSQEPAKLLPWKIDRASAESLLDHTTQVMKNGSAHENSVSLANVHNSIESDMGAAAMYKTLDHPPGPTNQAIPFDAQTPSNVFAAVGRGGLPTQSLQESVSDAENMAYQLQSQLLHGRPCATECSTPNNTLNGQQDLASDSLSVNISNAYSQRLVMWSIKFYLDVAVSVCYQISCTGYLGQGFCTRILNTLTQALHSSGVDLAQTSIGVQIDVGKRENSTTAVAPSSKDQVNQYLSNQVIVQDGVESGAENSEQAHKRPRREKC
uniref:BHLH domain-containing protein n=1 Tax=Salix viminalis TaxID=40686 RepID=A0A6N2L2G9_SALVM